MQPGSKVEQRDATRCHWREYFPNRKIEKNKNDRLVQPELETIRVLSMCWVLTLVLTLSRGQRRKTSARH